MSVNMSLGQNTAKTSRFGPIFHTIDYSSEKGNGILTIGNNKYKLSEKDLKDLYFDNKPSSVKLNESYEWKDNILTGREYLHLAETIEAAYNNVRKRQKLGL